MAYWQAPKAAPKAAKLEVSETSWAAQQRKKKSEAGVIGVILENEMEKEMENDMETRPI